MLEDDAPRPAKQQQLPPPPIVQAPLPPPPPPTQFNSVEEALAVLEQVCCVSLLDPYCLLETPVLTRQRQVNPTVCHITSLRTGQGPIQEKGQEAQEEKQGSQKGQKVEIKKQEEERQLRQ